MGTGSSMLTASPMRRAVTPQPTVMWTRQPMDRQMLPPKGPQIRPVMPVRAMAAE